MTIRFETPASASANSTTFSERYEQGASVITSNLDFPEWGDAF